MELDDIKQYSHKIKKIYINNKNKASQLDAVTIKISIKDKKDNEVIRFSTSENDGWLAHQSFDNDYFLEIPNRMESITVLYAHYFPSSLYDYIEDQNIFSVYDWSELIEEIPISQYHNESYLINDGEVVIDEDTYLINGNILVYNGNEYTIPYEGITIEDKKYYIRNNKLIIDGYTYYKTITSNQYDYILDDDNKLVVRSLLNNSINRFKDPNYKNYTKLINDNEISNQTEQGYFPLSSRYRGYKYLHAPDINRNSLPYWQNSNQSSRDCSRENDAPYWQTKIHRTGLSPLISEDSEDSETYMPINVYLNYQYLPTSTEYHQHYYGFEPKNPHNSNKIYDIAPNDTYEVLEGEKLSTVNKGFGKTDTEDTVYRLINHGNPFDTSHTITVQHGNTINVNLNQGIANNCFWDYNTCAGYYEYTPDGEGDVSINVELEEDEPYKLQYYIYIPSEAIVEYNSCTVSIEHRDEFGTITKVKELDEAFIQQDKFLRDQWIYHELDFIAEQNNRICIKGPQHHKGDRNIEIEEGQTYSKTNAELTIDDKIFFINFNLIKMEEYSPTIKYTETGMYLVEGSEYTSKPTKEQKGTYLDCVQTPALTSDDIWTTKNPPLPTPLKDVYFRFEDDFDIVYNDITTELSWTSGLDDCVFEFLPFDEYRDENLQWITDDNEISLVYDYLSDNGELKLWKKRTKLFTTGANNYFTLILQDYQGNPIEIGEVECAIVTSKSDRITPCNETVMCLGKRIPDEYGRVSYNKINFKKLRPSDTEVTYFLRVTYTNPCYNKTIIGFKPLLFEKEYRNINAYINKCNDSICLQNTQNNCCKLCASSIYNTSNHNYVLNQFTPYAITSIDELPLHIDVNIFNQLNIPIEEGYCELSINDRIIQSTIVDSRGVADFYIDFNDLYDNEDVVDGNYNYIRKHTIKIEYFTQYFETINFLYFDIVYQGEYDTREAIPIKTYAISDNTLLTTNEFHMTDKQSIFMLNIDTEGYTNFSITIENNNQREQKNITTSNNTLLLIGEYNNRRNEVYTITTGNLIGEETTGPYRKTRTSFTVVWE